MSKDSMDKLLDVMNVLTEIDLVLLPMVPTEKMCNAAADRTGIDPETVRTIYTIMMLNAGSTQEPEERGPLH